MTDRPPHDDPGEVDETGVRAILSGLPPPGPMPPEVVGRIERTLAEEATGTSGPAPVLPLRRHRPGRAASWVAAGAAVAVGAVVVSGQLFGGDPLLTPTAQVSDDAGAGTGAAEGSGGDAGAPAGDGGADRPESHGGESRDAAGGASQDAGDEGLDALLLTLDSSTLGDQVRSWHTGTGGEPGQAWLDQAEAGRCAEAAEGGTPSGMGSGPPSETTAMLVVLDRNPAVLVLVDRTSGPVAWLVDEACRDDASAPVLHGPISLR